MLIHCDSIATIAKFENNYYYGKRRQIRRNHNIVRDYISKGAIRVDHVPTNKDLADPVMKGLTRKKVHNTSNKIGLIPKVSCS